MASIDSLLEKVAEALRPDFVVAELRVAGLETETVYKVHGVEELSTLFRYDVDVALAGPPPNLSSVIGTEANLLVRDVHGNERTVIGIVAEIVVRSFDDESHRADVVIRPKVWRQFLGRDCFAMQEVTSPDVIKEVLADYPGKTRYDLVRSYPSYPYRVQYREDDWTYVSRLTEEEGIYYWFDHEGDDSTVVFADSSTTAPAIEGIPALVFSEASQMRPDQEGVVEVSYEARMTSDKFSGKSFDPDRPLLSITETQGDGKREDYDAPGAGPFEPSVLARRIADSREAATAARSGVAGTALTSRLTPGRTFMITGHPVAAFDQELLITHVEVTAAAKVPASTKFRAIPKSVPYRAPHRTPRAKQAGLQMGQVVGPPGQEVHPDARGRVRTQLHWDRTGEWNDKSGTWMRVDQRGAPGSMLLPRMGWNVATFNEEGGVDAPAILCRIHDAEHPPEYALPANMTRVVWKTATTPGGGSHNEIYFEDAAGREEMFINASKDMNLRTRHIKNEFVENDSLRVVGVDHELHVEDSHLERIGGNQATQVGGNETLEVQVRVSKDVTGNENRSIGGSRRLKAGDSITSVVDKNRSLSVGAAMLDISLGDIMAHATKSKTELVGGAKVRISGQSITDAAAKFSVQAIGGAKIEIAKTERTTSVTKFMREMIGGTLIVKTNAEYIDNADKIQNIVVGGAITGKAPEVWVEAVESIKLKVGASTITITKDTIKFEGTSVDLSGAHLDADTASIEHN